MSANGVTGAHGSDATGQTPAAESNVDLGEISFGSVLRAINPLQYLPVVGTIYRVATDDAAPTGLRTAVSAVVGALTGGPIGLITSILGSLAEQFLHVEDRVRQAFAPSAAARATIQSGPSQLPAASAVAADGSARNAPPPDSRKVTAAYAEAGLLGAM